MYAMQTFLLNSNINFQSEIKGFQSQYNNRGNPTWRLFLHLAVWLNSGLALFIEGRGRRRRKCVLSGRRTSVSCQLNGKILGKNDVTKQLPGRED